MVRRDVHNGIVGARVRGAEESSFPIIVFLDSHVEVSEGWLEPMVARISDDPTRIIIPRVASMDINTLELHVGSGWPPSRTLLSF